MSDLNFERQRKVADCHQAHLSAAAFCVTVHASRKLLCWGRKKKTTQEKQENNTH